MLEKVYELIAPDCESVVVAKKLEGWTAVPTLAYSILHHEKPRQNVSFLGFRYNMPKEQRI